MREVCARLEFPVVALPGVGHMPAAAGENEKEAAWVFYVAAAQRMVTKCLTGNFVIQTA